MSPRRLGALVASLGLALAATVSQASPTWARAVDPGWEVAPVGTQVNVLMTSAPDGADLAVWAVGASGTSNTIHGEYRPAGSATWHDVPDALTLPYANVVQVVATAHGDFVMLVTTYIGGKFGSRVVTFDSSARRWSKPQKPFPTTKYQSEPSSVAVAADGTILVWGTAPTLESMNPPHYRTEVAIKRPGGSWHMQLLTPKNDFGGGATVGVTPDGRAAATYIRGYDLSAMTVYGAVLPHGATRWTTHRLSDVGDAQRAYLGVGGDGSVVVAWDAPSSSSTAVRVATTSLTAHPSWSAPLTLASGTTPGTPVVGVGRTGDSAVSWHAGGQLLVATGHDGTFTAPTALDVGSETSSQPLGLVPLTDGDLGLWVLGDDGNVEGFRYAVIHDGTPATPVHVYDESNMVYGSPSIASDAASRSALTWFTGTYPNYTTQTVQQDQLGPALVRGPYDGRSARPTVSGVHQVGHVLTCHPGYWVETAHLSFAWKRGSAAISGATHRTYSLTRADRGHPVTGRGRGVALTRASTAHPVS